MSEHILALQAPDPAHHLRPVLLKDTEPLWSCCWRERSLTAVNQVVTRAQRLARQGTGIGVVVVKDGALIGYGQLTMWLRCGEISDLVVAESWRGQGIGTTLIQYLTRMACSMHAECVEIGAALDNPGALALYRRLGFVDDRVIKLTFASGPVDVLYLRIDIPLGTECI